MQGYELPYIDRALYVYNSHQCTVKPHACTYLYTRAQAYTRMYTCAHVNAFMCTRKCIRVHTPVLLVTLNLWLTCTIVEFACRNLKHNSNNVRGTFAYFLLHESLVGTQVGWKSLILQYTCTISQLLCTPLASPQAWVIPMILYSYWTIKTHSSELCGHEKQPM